MKVSIVTVCYNSAETIENTLISVLSQSYTNIEYIIVDGQSTDATLEIIGRYKSRLSKVISEPDNGIYDAINKGILLASGELVGVLNSDDFYVNSTVIEEVVNELRRQNADCVYGDLQYVDRQDTNIVKRNWVSGKYEHGLFFKGWMPPHPTFFIKNDCYKKYGLFNLKLKSAADYELMLRMLHLHQIKAAYLPKVLVKMRVGGKSNISLMNRIKANREDKLAWDINGIKPKFYTLLMKPLSKLGQFFS
ncbi:MAG TPA: glycosyltransferase family 2 protein [Bacteroidia bacterium]|nr:glycosyltransferase family 2 protein [Bacteroidia bacterium]